jgi:CRISPR/Cas system-associated endoribonuclease Cas2
MEWVLCYDIVSPKRRRYCCRRLRTEAQRYQQSVFELPAAPEPRVMGRVQVNERWLLVQVEECLCFHSPAPLRFDDDGHLWWGERNE